MRKKFEILAVLVFIVLFLSNFMTVINYGTLRNNDEFEVPSEKPYAGVDILESTSPNRGCFQIAYVINSSSSLNFFQKYNSTFSKIFELAPYEAANVNIVELVNFSMVIFDPGVNALDKDGVILDVLKLKKPVLFLGKSHNVLDSIINSQTPYKMSESGEISINEDFSSSQILNKPFKISGENLVNDEGYLECLNLSYENREIDGIVSLKSNGLWVLASFNLRGVQKVLWFSVEDPSTLSSNGMKLLLNILLWLSSKDKLSVLSETLTSMQIKNSSYFGYGGIYYQFTPSIRNTYFYVKALLLLGETPNTTQMRSFLASHYDQGGYFEDEYVRVGITSRMEATARAVLIIKELGLYYSLMNETKVINFMMSHKMVDGGFSDDGSRSDVISTWSAVNVFEAFNSYYNRTEVKEFLKSLQKDDESEIDFGGFSCYLGGSAAVEYSYYAVESLKLLGGLDEINKTSLESFLNGCIEDGGFLDSPFPREPMYSTGKAILIINETGLWNILNTTKSLEFINHSMQIEGGFSSNPSDRIPKVENTFFTVASLKVLGYVSKYAERIKSYLDGCLRPEGGASESMYLGDLWHTTLSAMIMDKIGKIYDLNLTSLVDYINSCYIGSKPHFQIIRVLEKSIYPAPYEFKDLGLYNVINDYFSMKSLYLISKYHEVNLDLYNSQISLNFKDLQILDTGSKYYGMFKGIESIPPDDFNTRFETTVFSTLLLHFLGREDYVDKGALFSYINKTYISQNEPPKPLYVNETIPIVGENSSLDTLFFSLKMLDSLQGINSSWLSLAVNVLSKGIDYSILPDVYYFLETLEILRKYRYDLQVDRNSVLESLNESWGEDGIFHYGLTSSYWIDCTRMALDIIDMMGLEPLILRSYGLNLSTLEVGERSLILGQKFNLTLGFNPEKYNNFKYVFVINGNLEYDLSYEVAISGGEINIRVPFTDKKFVGNSNLTILVLYGGLFPYFLEFDLNVSAKLDLFVELIDLNKDEGNVSATFLGNVTTYGGQYLDGVVLKWISKVEGLTIRLEEVGNGIFSIFVESNGSVNRIEFNLTSERRNCIPASKNVFLDLSEAMSFSIELDKDFEEILINESLPIDISINFYNFTSGGTLYVYVNDTLSYSTSFHEGGLRWTFDSKGYRYGTYNISFLMVTYNGASKNSTYCIVDVKRLPSNLRVSYQDGEMIKLDLLLFTIDNTPIIHHNLTIRVVWSDGIVEEYTLETDQDGKYYLEISPRSSGDVEFYVEFKGTEYYEPSSYSFALNVSHEGENYLPLLLVLSSISFAVLIILLIFKYKRIGIKS
ncbi:MAG: prenyltransferase/squalene oxidase repeat-containing protein [Candidatus Asgardarchaeia archaeon]